MFYSINDNIFHRPKVCTAFEEVRFDPGNEIPVSKLITFNAFHLMQLL